MLLSGRRTPSIAADIDLPQDPRKPVAFLIKDTWPAMRAAMVLFPVAIAVYFGTEDLLRLVFQPGIRRLIGNNGWYHMSDGWLDFAPIFLRVIVGSYLGARFPKRGALGTLIALLLLSIIGLPIFARNFALATDMRHPHVWHAGENYYAFSAEPVLFEPGSCTGSAHIHENRNVPK